MSMSAGGNAPLHLHPLLNTTDVYGHGKPTRIANADRDLRRCDEINPRFAHAAYVRGLENERRGNLEEAQRDKLENPNAEEVWPKTVRLRLAL